MNPIDDLPSTESIPMLSGANSDLQITLDQLKVDAQQTNGDTSSIRSRLSQLSRDGKNSDDDELPPTTNTNPRAVLAAKAAANAEKEAKNERAREKAESERAATNSYDLSRDGLIEGIQISDESEEEEEVVRGELLPEAISSSSNGTMNGVTEVASDNRPRVNSSTSATSIYADESRSSARAITPPPLPLPITSTPPTNSSQATPPLPTSARHFALDSIIPSAAVQAATVGLAGVGATTAAVYLNHREPSPQTSQQNFNSSSSTPTLSSSTNNIPPPITMPTNINPTLQAANTPPPTLVSHFLNSNPSQTYATSPANSLGSMNNQSRSSSRQDTGNFASAGTSDTSPRDSTYGNGSKSSTSNGKISNLPADPTTWGVREVVEWGKMKGFDGLTLAKFEGRFCFFSLFFSSSKKVTNEH